MATPWPLEEESLRFLEDECLNAEVAQLHAWAREGAIDQETAEMHLNSFLGAKTRMLVMPVLDAPQFGNLPDLWVFVSRALTGRGEDLLTGLIRWVVFNFGEGRLAN